MKLEKLDMFSVLIAAVSVCVVLGLMTFSRPEPEKQTVDPGAFLQSETELINSSDSVMRVLLVTEHEDSVILRKRCSELSGDAISSGTFRELSEKMLKTVQAPQYDGVGIAAPQVGISRRVIAVCRMDKPGEPFEVYANASLDSLYGPLTHGPEGCLSIPGLRGNVYRHSSVIVSYLDAATLEQRRDTVFGYTAIIFQHECDHLDGVLYTDKADSVRVAD